MGDFNWAHKFTAKWEGGISDHPADKGGYTAYGVCTAFMEDLWRTKGGQALLESIGLFGPITKSVMRKITKEKAAQIFHYAFWNPLNLEKIPDPLACVWYDMAVNHGKAGGTRMIQQALNNSVKAKLKVDGISGPLTQEAAMREPKKCAEEALRIRINFFKNLCQVKPSQQVFLKGWTNRAKDLQSYIAKC